MPLMYVTAIEDRSRRIISDIKDDIGRITGITTHTITASVP